MLADLVAIRPCTGSPRFSSDHHHSGPPPKQNNFGAIGSFRTNWLPRVAVVKSSPEGTDQLSPARQRWGGNVNEEQVPEGRTNLAQRGSAGSKVNGEQVPEGRTNLAQRGSAGEEM